MTIASEISRLQTAKACLKASIESKGVTVGSDLTIDEYFCCVDAIKEAPPTRCGCIDILVVGGGGNGGAWTCKCGGGGGGGGAGGFIECQGLEITSETPIYGVLVGNKGACSCAFGITALGGGNGANNGTGGAGASGGGGGGRNANGGTGTSGQGYNGGRATERGGGGGGGAGAVGGDGFTDSYGRGEGGWGGNGKCSCISGTCCWYAGGGGGGNVSGCGINRGGNGGGGAGGCAYNTGCGNGGNATYYGSGGGGGGQYGGSGYQGIVIIRYKSDGSCGISSAIGGTCKYTCGDYTIHCYTTVGDNTFIPTFTN